MDSSPTDRSLQAAANRVLRNLVFRCPVRAGAASSFFDQGFQLRNGRYDAPPEEPGSALRDQAELLPDLTVVAGISSHDSKDAVAVIVESGGGTGAFEWLYVVRDVFGVEAWCSHSIFLGDRVHIEEIRANEPGTVTVNLLSHAPDDPMAAPSQRIQRSFHLHRDVVDAFQRVSGGPWMPYRPLSWSVESFRGGTWNQVEGSVWETNDGEAIWGALCAAASINDEGVVPSLQRLIDGGTIPRGDRLSARRINAEGLESLRSGIEPARSALLFAHALKADPGDVEIANNLGYALLLVGDLDGAVEALGFAIKLDPQRWTAWLNLGEAMAGSGVGAGAIGAFRMAMRQSAGGGEGRRAVQKLAGASEMSFSSISARAALSDEVTPCLWSGQS